MFLNAFINFTNHIYQEGKDEIIVIENYGRFEKSPDKYQITFQDKNLTKEMIQINYSLNEIVIERRAKHHKATLRFVINKDVDNDYVTEYGVIKLTTRIISYQFDESGFVLKYVMLINNEENAEYKIVVKINEVKDNGSK